jgi:hypothetical protein
MGTSETLTISCFRESVSIPHKRNGENDEHLPCQNKDNKTNNRICMITSGRMGRMEKK